MGKMTVYHGSYTVVKEPKVVKSRNTKDFGNGFYCTIIREQAERWARRYETPMVNVYTVRMDESLKILEFSDMTEEWLDFIIDCRHGKTHDYDIVIGPIADDGVAYLLNRYEEGSYTIEELARELKYKKLNSQYFFANSRAVSLLRRIK